MRARPNYVGMGLYRIAPDVLEPMWMFSRHEIYDPAAPVGLAALPPDVTMPVAAMRAESRRAPWDDTGPQVGTAGMASGVDPWAQGQ